MPLNDDDRLTILESLQEIYGKVSEIREKCSEINEELYSILKDVQD